MTTRMLPKRLIAALLGLWIATGSTAVAQSSFNPAIMVNEDAITFYEIDQRIRLLELFNTPGDLPSLAREQLIDDRLRSQELRRARLSLSEEALARELEAFAGRADLPYDQFLGVLAQNGIAEETLRDFVEIGVSWRDFVRSRYTSRSAVNERDIDLEIANLGGGGSRIEVLLNEIIIAAPPPRAAQAAAAAERISRLTTIGAFQAAAREVSALPSRERGGALDWAPIDNYPPQIGTLLLALSPGEVTQPLPIPNGIALFQLRAVREVAVPRAAPALIDYAVLTVAGGPAEAQAVAARADTCDDLYGIVPPASVARAETAPGQIPGDIALRLAPLDPGEIAFDTAPGGTRLVMLCSRTPEVEGGIDREAIESRLRSQRLSGFSDQLLARLQAQATIRRFE
ncbi:peptidylprolyl isomerase [Histidinibacterium lentulum]|nr:peptidylprolyl isomerase [Histidinibacterium lentulum]